MMISFFVTICSYQNLIVLNNNQPVLSIYSQQLFSCIIHTCGSSIYNYKQTKHRKHIENYKIYDTQNKSY